MGNTTLSSNIQDFIFVHFKGKDSSSYLGSLILLIQTTNTISKILIIIATNDLKLLKMQLDVGSEPPFRYGIYKRHRQTAGFANYRDFRDFNRELLV